MSSNGEYALVTLEYLFSSMDIDYVFIESNSL